MDKKPKKWIIPMTDLDPKDFVGLNLLPKDLRNFDEKPTPNAYLKEPT